jgi:hypothetical protein
VPGEADDRREVPGVAGELLDQHGSPEDHAEAAAGQQPGQGRPIRFTAVATVLDQAPGEGGDGPHRDDQDGDQHGEVLLPRPAAHGDGQREEPEVAGGQRPGEDGERQERVGAHAGADGVGEEGRALGPHGAAEEHGGGETDRRPGATEQDPCGHEHGDGVDDPRAHERAEVDAEDLHRDGEQVVLDGAGVEGADALRRGRLPDDRWIGGEDVERLDDDERLVAARPPVARDGPDAADEDREHEEGGEEGGDPAP